jgi:hypothetical protein
MYYLPSNVYACCTGRYCIFLDLHRDRYLSVPRTSVDPLSPLVNGWRITDVPEVSPPGEDTQVISHFAEQLVTAGLLSQRPAYSKPATPVVVPPRESDVLSFGRRRDHQPLHANVTAALRVANALLRARILLSIRPMRTLAARFNEREPRTSIPYDERSVRKAIELATVFMRYRPYFPHNYLCMLDSLALMSYLAQHDAHAMWVFGVREDPFLAHCWVQSGTVVLNDYADSTSAYTPIMVL